MVMDTNATVDQEKI